MIISIAVYGFGGCVTFLVIIGDQLVPVVQYLGFVQFCSLSRSSC